MTIKGNNCASGKRITSTIMSSTRLTRSSGMLNISYYMLRLDYLWSNFPFYYCHKGKNPTLHGIEGRLVLRRRITILFKFTHLRFVIVRKVKRMKDSRTTDTIFRFVVTTSNIAVKSSSNPLVTRYVLPDTAKPRTTILRL